MFCGKANIINIVKLSQLKYSAHFFYTLVEWPSYYVSISTDKGSLEKNYLHVLRVITNNSGVGW